MLYAFVQIIVRGIRSDHFFAPTGTAFGSFMTIIFNNANPGRMEASERTNGSLPLSLTAL
jgi:hypothetical protein